MTDCRRASKPSPLLFAGMVFITSIALVACGSGTANRSSANSTTTVVETYGELVREVNGESTRALHQLDTPDDELLAPALVAGYFENVRPGSGWVNIPDLAQEAGGADTKKVPYDSKEAHFRTVLVDLRPAEILAGDEKLIVGDREFVTFELILPGQTTIDSAEADLSRLGRVILLIDQWEIDQNDGVYSPAGGGDIVIEIQSNGLLSMPFASEETAAYTLGTITSLDGLREALRSRQ